MSDDRLYFRQLLSGRDFATGDGLARQMVNFVYAIGDRTTGECVLVDPAYSAAELVELVGADGMTVTGALATHYHPDHIGGSMMGYAIDGVAELIGIAPVKVHCQAVEAEFVRKVTGISASDVVTHDAGDTITVGAIEIRLVATPGHTPGSQCFLLDDKLVSGDTLFLDGCGRTDFPGSSPEQMYESLQALAKLPGQTVVYPGHQYHPAASASLEAVKANNYVYRPRTKEQWLAMFGS